jgi:hypothetical protein
MKKTAITLLALLGLTCRPAAADEIKLEILPQCLKYTVPNVGLVCGYKNLADVQLLYTLDAELELHRDVKRLEKAKIHELENQIIHLRAAEDARKRAADLLKDRNQELVQQLIDTDRRLQKERVKPRWGNPLAWTLSAVLAASLSTVLVVVALE